MKPLHLILAVFVACAVLVYASPASAQAKNPKYDRPPRPVFSPWLDLFRRDPGPVGRYHSYVRPKQQLRQTLSQQQTQIRQQRLEIQTLRNNAIARQRAAAAGPTGAGASFMRQGNFMTHSGKFMNR